MWYVKTFKSIFVNLIIMGLLQLSFSMISIWFPLKVQAATNTASTSQTNPEANPKNKITPPTKPIPGAPKPTACNPTGTASESKKCDGINQSTTEWVDAANQRKQGYTLPPSEIARLKKQAERNEKILKDNERLINSFYSALAALGIDAMEEATANLELLTAKLKTETLDLKDHTANELKPAIDDFEDATSNPLTLTWPVAGIVGGLAWASTGPKANKAVEENNIKSDKLYETTKQVWSAVDKMVEVDQASYDKALALAVQTKSEALALLKSSVNDSYQLTPDSTNRDFRVDMLTNTDILGVSTASCLDLDCSNLGDAFSVSYHLFKAASAVYLSTNIRLISAYNENQADIMKSTPNEEGKFDTQTEQIMIAENVRGESVDFGDKLKAAKTVLDRMWARVLEVAQLELRQKEARAAAEQAQGGSGDGASQALDDAADNKNDHGSKSKKWLYALAIAAIAGIICCYYPSNTTCGWTCGYNITTAVIALAVVIIVLMLYQKSNDSQDKADDATQKVNDRAGGGGGGGGGGGAESALHTKAMCLAAGNNMYVSYEDLRELEEDILRQISIRKRIVQKLEQFNPISSAWAGGTKISTALGLIEGQAIYNLFVKSKIAEAKEMSEYFGEPETRIQYLSSIVALAAQGAGESDSMTNPNLAELKNKTGNLSDDMMIFGDKKEVDAKKDDANSNELYAGSNESANLPDSNIQMGSVGILGNLGKGKTGSSIATNKNSKTKAVRGGDYLRRLAGKLNALGDDIKNKRNAKRVEMGLDEIKENSLDFEKLNALRDSKRIQILQEGLAMGGTGAAALSSLLDELKASQHGKKGRKGDPSLDSEIPIIIEEGDDSFGIGGLGNGEPTSDAQGEGGGAKSIKKSDPTKDQSALLDMEQYNKAKKEYTIKDNDSLWEKVTKIYQKVAYPILMPKKPSEEGNQ